MKTKEISVILATHIAFNEMPKIFHILSLVSRVRNIVGNEHVMDGNITRRLRELRSWHKINYKVIKKFYHKK